MDSDHIAPSHASRTGLTVAQYKYLTVNILQNNRNNEHASCRNNSNVAVELLNQVYFKIVT